MSTDPAEIVADAVRRGVVPGAVLVYGRGADGPVRGGAFGTEVTTQTGYDLASLTKVVATLPLALRLVDAGELGLDDPVARYLPDFARDASVPVSGNGKDRVTIRQLLAHSSGLPAHREVWRLPGTARDRFAAVLAEPLESAPGSAVRYSDLGFILLGRIIADVAGQPLDRAFAQWVAAPLGLAATGYRPAVASAATEANWFDDPERRDPKSSVVHDENAESLGGVAGHAGLFGTGSDLATYLRSGWLAPDSPILSPALRVEALRCQTEGLDGRRGLGWTLRGDSFDFLPGSWPPAAAGHTGFTGTSVALDPETGIWAVLLTNAVLLGRENRTRELRRSLHTAIAEEFGVAGSASNSGVSDIAADHAADHEPGTGPDGGSRGSRITT
ncbi:MAG: serine hydrolase domain-containing protein [Catenulispora sp.]